MADANSASDTQVLLQSMLQRLQLQSKPESSYTHTQDKVQYNTRLTEQNGSAPESAPKTPPMYNFVFSTDSKSNLPGPQSPGLTPFSQEFTKGIVHGSGTSSTPKHGNLSWGFMNNHTVSGGNSDVIPTSDDGVMPKQPKEQKPSDGSVSSLQSIERSLPSVHTSGQMESSIQGQGTAQKRWTQKFKEKWKERHKSPNRREQDDTEQTNVANSIRSPIPVQTVPSKNIKTTTFEEHQAINNYPFKDIPSPLDQIGDNLFSPGSFNLMDEIFTGQEWAKFLSPSTSNQSEFNSIKQNHGMGLMSSINQSQQNDQTSVSQWNYRGATDRNMGMTQSQMNSGSFHNTNDNTFNQRTTLCFGMPPVSELHNGQYGLSDSRYLESMDLSGSTLGNNHPINEPGHISLYNQSNDVELNVNPSLPSQQSVNQSQTTEINHNQPGRVHEVIPLLDLSYVQSTDSSSQKNQLLLSRKRVYSTERRDSNERWSSEPGNMHEWRHNSSLSDPAPSLSSTSSTSSLQNSFSQDSDSAMSPETVIKKRRLENTRHVRFAEEVTFVPPLILYDDDSDPDEEDYGHNNEGNGDGREESPPRTTVPRWIEALRSKKTRKSKIKLPRMRAKKYRFM